MPAGPEEIAHALQRLKSGGLAAFPTETVYGLGALATSEQAVRRVFSTKGRPPENPLIVHVSGEPMARAFAGAWPPAAARLAQRFWPGPLSIIVPRSPRIPPIVTAGGPTMALRCPNHPITLALLEALGEPLVGPSANPSGRISPTTAQHVRDAFPEDQVYVLDGGPCAGGIESTVVAIDGGGGAARVLRPGLISPEQIAEALGVPSVEVAARTATTGPLESPGLLDSHYAPTAPAFLFTPDQWPTVRAAAARGHTRILSATPDPATTDPMPADPAAYAARLYAALRDADATHPRAIYIEHPGPASHPTWAAILDRLRRATRPLEPR